MIKTYYNLTKPGIIYGNAVSTIAGFLLASKGTFNLKLFLATLVGISLVIAAACVFNNLFDRDIDELMARTKQRAMVKGEIPKNHAVVFGLVLLVFGAIILRQYTNNLALLVALTGFFVYVALYTPLKRRSIHATLVGAIAGAVPPVVGYTAVTNRLDLGAWLLLLILVAWQMPHFYAIAIRRRDEYMAAGVPVLSVKKGIKVTKIHILAYILVFLAATILLRVFGFTGNAYLVVVILLGLIWFWMGLQGFKPNTDDKAWAKKMFLFSLVVLLIFSLTVSIGARLA